MVCRLATKVVYLKLNTLSDRDNSAVTTVRRRGSKTQVGVVVVVAVDRLLLVAVVHGDALVQVLFLERVAPRVDHVLHLKVNRDRAVVIVKEGWMAYKFSLKFYYNM